MIESGDVLVKSKGGRALLFRKETCLMFERILLAAAAVATIAGFLLEAWREIRSKKPTDDEGRKKKGRS